MDILIGILVLALILGVGYVVTHHKPPATVAGADLANTVSAAVAGSWEALQRDLPQIISAEVAQLRADKAALTSRAEQAEAALAAEVQASGARLEAVKAQVGSFIAGIGSLPASAVPVAAVVAAQSQDAARVVAFADQINPAQSAQA